MYWEDKYIRLTSFQFGINFPKMVSVVSPQQVERYAVTGTSTWMRKAFKKIEWRDLIKWALSCEGMFLRIKADVRTCIAERGNCS